MKRKLTASQKQTVKWVGAGAILLAGLLLTTSNADYKNNALMKINDEEIFFIGSNFENQANGDHRNEGTIIFTGDINNVGKFDCGNCESGASYLRNDMGNLQTVTGNGVIRMHDLIVDNSEGVDLEIELRIKNSLDFTQGAIHTDRDFGNEAYVLFEDDAIVANMSNDKHVDGYVAKAGKGEFVLPTGNGSRLLPVQITGNADVSMFKAAFYDFDPTIGGSYVGGPFPNSEYDFFELTYVSSDGFWDIEGNTSTNITLSWDGMSNISTWAGSIDSVTVAGWTGSEWVSLGHDGSKGDLIQGTVTSRSVIPNNYEAFTLARRTPGAGPVDLLTFDAVQKGDDGYLFWTTAKEVNTFYFDVERSLDAIIFEKFGVVEAAGNSDSSLYYDFWDEGVALRDLDRIFYRIRQVDLDGQFIYSQVEELVFDDAEEEIDLVIYPNPVVDIVTIRYVARAALEAKVRIFNMLGQIVYADPTALGGSGEYTIDLTRFAIGHYVIVLGNDEIQASKKIVVTH